MKVTFANNQFDIREGTTLLQWLEENDFSKGQGIAVAVNETVVSAQIWGERILKDGDQITVIKATAGG